MNKVACNKAIDFFRLASRNKRLQDLVRSELTSDTEKFADHNVLESECQDILNKAMQQLSPQRHIVFSLSREHGLTHEAIASKLNLSRHTVRNRIAESLKVIRQFLKEHHYPVFITFYLISGI